MTVPVQSPITNHTGNGATVTFPYQFLLLQNTDLAVSVDDVAKVYGVHYSVTGLGIGSGGSITFFAAPANGAKVVIRRSVSLSRDIDYQYQGDFQSKTVNNDFDRIWLALQDTNLSLSTAIRFPSNDATSPILPAAAARALRTLAFDASGALALVPTSAGDSTALALALASSAQSTQGTGLIGMDGGTLYNFFRDKSAKVIETIAELRTLKSTATRNAFVKCHTSAAGLGGGAYRYDSTDVASADNNGTTIVASDGGRWKLIDSAPTVHTFGAIGDGTASDATAVLAMLAATNGTLRLLDREYLVGQLNAPDYDRLTIEGRGMPTPNAARDKLVGGSILVGGFAIRANVFYFRGFGVCNGAARGLVGIADGCVVNSKTGETGAGFGVDGFAVLGPTSAGTTHGLLIQGFDRGYVYNVFAGKHQFGVVTKCRNVTIDDVDGDDLRTALVYPKSDTSANAGGVLSGAANDFEISNVRHRASNSNITASAVYLQASTLAFSSARVSNVSTTYGLAALRIQGGGLIGDPAISGVVASNIRSERAQYALYSGGYTYDWSVSNVQAINPATGRAVYMDSGTFGWNLQGVHVAISDAAITTDVVMEVFGEGQWDGLTVRNPFRTMNVKSTFGVLATVKTGKLSGQAINSQDITLAGINGAVAVAAPNAPTQRILPGSVLKLAGSFTLTASANKFFCNLPIGVGKVKRFACSGIDSTNAVVSIAVLLNDFQLSVEPALPTGFKQIDLDNITVAL